MAPMVTRKALQCFVRGGSECRSTRGDNEKVGNSWGGGGGFLNLEAFVLL